MTRRPLATLSTPDHPLPRFLHAGVSRRDALRGALALSVLPLAGAAHAEDATFDPTGRMPTPDQILGPYYPMRKPQDGGTDLTRLAGRAGTAQGEAIIVTGRVTNLRGEPLAGVRMEIWQANAGGKYTHPSDGNRAPIDPNFDGYANFVTDADGRYRIRTVKPGAYPVVADYVRPPHIHFDIRGRVNRLISQMYFEGEALNAKDPLLQGSWAKDSLIAHWKGGADLRVAEWDIVLIQG